MLHALPAATSFDQRRQLAELESVASSAASMIRSIRAPTTGAFLNWFPLVPMAT